MRDGFFLLLTPSRLRFAGIASLGVALALYFTKFRPTTAPRQTTEPRRASEPFHAADPPRRGQIIPADVRGAMIAHALEEDPNECCGLLAGSDGVVRKHYRVTNAERSPYRYSMDGRELNAALREIDDSGWELQVIYHSHTHSPAYPSDTDVRLAANWPDPYYLLISLLDKSSPDVRLFTIADGEIAEEEIEVA